MLPSQYNVYVDVPERGEAFLMNTLWGARAFVSPDVIALLERLRSDGDDASQLAPHERETIDQLTQLKFVVDNYADERKAFEQVFEGVCHDSRMMTITLGTTMQCNFACEYCFQGDHDAYNRDKSSAMTLETAAQVVEWAEAKFDALGPEGFHLYLFGGEPLLNLPIASYLAEQLWNATQKRGIPMDMTLITNGYLLTPEIVKRLLPFGLLAVKITLDGDKPTHDSRRHLVGGQGTFDRIINNIRSIAGLCAISIGGNFDEGSVDGFASLTSYLRQQDFADDIDGITFGAVVRKNQPLGARAKGCGCQTSAAGQDHACGGHAPRANATADATPSGPASPLPFYKRAPQPDPEPAMASKNFDVADALANLRRLAVQHDFPTRDVEYWFSNPCDVHKRHAYTIGPDGSLYSCPGFSGEKNLAVGHVDPARHSGYQKTAAEFDRLAAWNHCGDCALIPVCAGGCAFNAYFESGEFTLPLCHKKMFVDALATIAHQQAGLPEPSLETGRALVRQTGGQLVCETPWPTLSAAAPAC